MSEYYNTLETHFIGARKIKTLDLDIKMDDIRYEIVFLKIKGLYNSLRHYLKQLVVFECLWFKWDKR
jgi:hypothetical protein